MAKNYIKGKKKISKKDMIKIINEDMKKMSYYKLVYMYNYTQKIMNR